MKCKRLKGIELSKINLFTVVNVGDEIFDDVYAISSIRIDGKDKFKLADAKHILHLLTDKSNMLINVTVDPNTKIRYFYDSDVNCYVYESNKISFSRVFPLNDIKTWKYLFKNNAAYSIGAARKCFDTIFFSDMKIFECIYKNMCAGISKDTNERILSKLESMETVCADDYIGIMSKYQCGMLKYLQNK